MVELEEADRVVLQRLEEAMWRAETRFDPEWMDRHVTDDFLEFGRSGRVYDKSATVACTPEDIDIVLPLPGFEACEMVPGVALVTYRSIRTIDGEILHANRASVWVVVDGEWRMRFHQGTPVPDPCP